MKERRKGVVKTYIRMEINMKEHNKGGFTLPGQSGYEELTLKMAEKWGADVIRDSDGTRLSDEIIKAGYDIYSTICIIRDHNQWARQHPEYLQQTFLMSEPIMAKSEYLEITPMDGFFKEQFEINDSKESMKYWQVFNRTTNKELSKDLWEYRKEDKKVIIKEATPFHQYTVNFMAYRIWEEISMYNHVTNNWDKEHLMPVDPWSKEAQDYLYSWLDKWCKEHPETTVVRFTSLFYNFVWIWGESEKRRNIYTDWGSYDFTVSPKALDDFEKEYGYQLSSEDFINQGKLHVTHMPAEKKQLDYMEFINRFVVDYGSKLVKLVQSYGKKAYVFYDDSWVGLEPYSKLFHEFGFDGLIKCVFSGYEARLCSGVDVPVHELRLHPYLFPVGLGGAPTFSKDGDPTKEAKVFWNKIRRALLREPVDRIGLGGYLHLVEDYPDFCDYIEEVANEFRKIKQMHKQGDPYTLPCKVAVLHTWGSLRSWTLSGHFHETYMHDLIHINEALSGLPVDVSYINFEDVKNGKLSEFDVVINAGRAGTAWSGGKVWESEEVVTSLTKWVHEGGVFLGVNEPSAVEGFDRYFRMAAILGVDEDTGARVCHGRWDYDINEVKGLIPKGTNLREKENRYLVKEDVKVLIENNKNPILTVNDFGKGKGIYLSSFEFTNANTRLLLNLLMYGVGIELDGKYITDNKETECAYYPESKNLVVINNSDGKQQTSILTDSGRKQLILEPFETRILDLE